MKKVVIGLLILCVLLAGCSSPISSSQPTNTDEQDDSEGYVTDNGTTSDGQGTPVLPSGEEPPADMTWISPGKVNVANFYPGARAEYPLTVHNGNTEETEFAIYYRKPDHVDDGYVKAPECVQEWIIIADPTPVFEPRETRDILIVLEMPEDAESPGPNWEFWIAVKDTTQAGMVRTELATRWLVTMRQ